MNDGLIRVLVVDDSAFMRRAITRMLSSDPAFVVVGYGANGQEALDLAASLSPHVVLLDVEMPVMDGLSALKRLVHESKAAVIMMSTLTQEGADTTLAALEAGAFDFVSKPQASALGVFEVAQDLIAKLKAAAQSRRGHESAGQKVPHPGPAAPSPVVKRQANLPAVDVVAIGISTGGPLTLHELLAALPKDFPSAILIVQHMPVGFTQALARHLDEICAIEVREASDGDRLRAGSALIAKAGSHMVVRSVAGGPRIRLLEDSETQTWHKPSVDVMMDSIAKSHGPRALGLVMTGMGTDGLSGARAMKAAGAEIWAQDEASSVVYGMPRVVFEAGIVDRVLPLSRIPAELQERCSAGAPPHPLRLAAEELEESLADRRQQAILGPDQP